ncbi:MAG TPA: choice-of-anchor Q domain-containing protein, partial [Anaerolineae bacterium]|nr:choice-of-anchor Q domain-containing protein [Anaerolineae bacterium]
DGTVEVSNSTFADNSANTGGGIYSNYGGTLTVSNSTFSGNRSNYGDGGGGIYSGYNSTLTVSNSTFTGNSANRDGGGISHVGSDTVTLQNTIVANSPSGGNCTGVITDGGGNLSYPDTSCPGVNADPLLGPLQDNGGPTWTMEPGPGSPAINAGDAAACATPPVNNLDQRGVIRPVGPRCDMGAVEVNYLPVRTWLPLLLAQ